ncbi:MAG TPA: PhaM family polyhydroxyalkanoate granule multifunctional regulatory protein [Usitatibacter sp.]|nr:PhaM family polyhydroxyalkanoate granule multifunctional regulatory protein [Usitatibacter sp.]
MSKPVTPQEMFDLWQKMVNPSGYPLQSLMFPVLDPAEIEKKIAELETVEHWLKANLGMLQLTIKSLEYQRSLIKGGEKMREAMEGDGQGEIPNPALWAWNMMAQAGKDAMQAARPGPKPAQAPKRRARKPRKAADES